MASRKGSPNRNKQFLLKRLQDMYGEDFHPIMTMAANANEAQKKLVRGRSELQEYIDVNRMWSELAQYVEPKLKAVEHTVNEGNPLEIFLKDITGADVGLPSSKE